MHLCDGGSGGRAHDRKHKQREKARESAGVEEHQQSKARQLFTASIQRLILCGRTYEKLN